MGGIVLVYDVLALVPVTSLLAFVCSVVLTSLAPLLCAVSCIAALGSWWAAGCRPGLHRQRKRRFPAQSRPSRRAKRLAVLGIVLNVAAAVVPFAATGSILHAAHQAHVRLHVVSALVPESMDAAPDMVLSYAPGPAGRIEVYRPRHTMGSAPVLFDIHGGGWTRDGRMPATLRWFADHGWLVMRPDYSLATAQHPTWNVAPQQVTSAYRWAANHASSMGGDATTIAVLGDSAGGGLALNLAYDIAADPAGGVPAPKAVVALYPTVDIAAIAAKPRFGEATAAHYFVGGTPQQYPQRYRYLDARNHVRTAAPPTLVIQGQHDTFVPPSSVDAFADAARRQGVPITQINVPMADHAFDTIAAGSLGQQLVTGATERFLTEQLHA